MFLRFFATVSLSLLLSTAAQAAPICTTLEKAVSTGTASQKLNKFFDANWKYLMTEFPEWATYVGYPGQNDRWTDNSLEANERRDQEQICMLAVFKKIPRNALKGEERVSWDLFVEGLELRIEGQKFGGKYLIIDQLSGPHMDSADMLWAMPTATKKDYENMIARLEKVPARLEQGKYWMREGLKQKITPVKMFLQSVPAQFDAILTAKVEDSALYGPFKEIKTDLSAAEKSELQKRALAVIQDKVYPAMKDFKTFLVNDYIPGARTEIALTSLPNGQAWYAYQVKSQTTTHMTPDQLHELGLSEVARITKEMEKTKEAAKFKGDLQAFNKYLRSDMRFYYDKREDVMRGYRDIAKRADAELPRLFKTLPRLPYGVREMPDYKAKNAPAAYYEGGTLEGGRAGYFTANTYDVQSAAKWEMEALTLHEAVPGHHLQIALAQEIQGLPEFRKNDGHTAYVEGWGLYAESLGTEMGFYKDPYSKYGQLTYEIWRAVRLVVDTGMHSKGWTREQAIDYAMKLIAKSQREIEVEIDRYITWPGQALAYKVGELKFKELREKAKARLGDKFDLREFHDELLKHGSLPMSVVDKTINEWIAAQEKPEKPQKKTLN